MVSRNWDDSESSLKKWRTGAGNIYFENRNPSLTFFFLFFCLVYIRLRKLIKSVDQMLLKIFTNKRPTESVVCLRSRCILVGDAAHSLTVSIIPCPSSIFLFLVPFTNKGRGRWGTLNEFFFTKSQETYTQPVWTWKTLKSWASFFPAYKIETRLADSRRRMMTFDNLGPRLSSNS